MSVAAAATNAAASTGTPAAIASGAAVAAAATKSEGTEAAPRADGSQSAKPPEPAASMLADPAKKSEGQSTEAGESKDGKPAPAGELKITVPEGADVSPEALKSFTDMAKAVGLSSEAASKVVAWNLEQAKANDAAWKKQGQDWFNELSADPDFGKANLEKSQASVRRAVARFFDSATLSGLTEMGLDNHPGLVRALKRIGDTIKEDDSSTGAAGNSAGRAADQKAHLRAAYPSMFNEDGTPKP